MITGLSPAQERAIRRNVAEQVRTSLGHIRKEMDNPSPSADLLKIAGATVDALSIQLGPGVEDAVLSLRLSQAGKVTFAFGAVLEALAGYEPDAAPENLVAASRKMALSTITACAIARDRLNAWSPEGA